MKDLEQLLEDRAMEHDSPTLLFNLAQEYLISAKTISTGGNDAGQVGRHGTDYSQQAHLRESGASADPAADVGAGPVADVRREAGMTRLAWLIKPAVEASANAVKPEIEKLTYLRGMDAHTDSVACPR